MNCLKIRHYLIYLLLLATFGFASCHQKDPFGREKLMLIRSGYDMAEFAIREGRFPSDGELNLPEADGYFLNDRGDDFVIYLEKDGDFLCYYRNDFQIMPSLEEVRRLLDQSKVGNEP